jgi:hypothetical protein
MCVLLGLAHCHRESRVRMLKTMDPPTHALPPLLTDNRFKLCLFASNVTGGLTISTAEGVNDRD